MYPGGAYQAMALHTMTSNGLPWHGKPTPGYIRITFLLLTHVLTTTKRFHGGLKQHCKRKPLALISLKNALARLRAGLCDLYSPEDFILKFAMKSPSYDFKHG